MAPKTKKSSDLTEDPPTSIDPYEVLSLEHSATEDEIKKAYRKAALKHHPDKATEEESTSAKEKFQQIALAYAILSEPRRRRRYDSTGSTAETLDFDDDDFDWLSFYREQYDHFISDETIEEDKRQYQGSEEEREDVLEAYKRSKGNMDKIHESIVHSNVIDDDERFRSIIDKAIADEKVEEYEKYTKESEQSKATRLRRAQREAKEAEKASKEVKSKKNKKNGQANEQSLAALIQQRQQGRQSRFFEHLEEKYGASAKANGKKRGPQLDEPPEEAFAATAERAKKSRK